MKRVLWIIVIAIPLTVFVSRLLREPAATPTGGTATALQAGKSSEGAAAPAANQADPVAPMPAASSESRKPVSAVQAPMSSAAAIDPTIDSGDQSSRIANAAQGLEEPDSMTLLGAELDSDQEFARLTEALRIAGSPERSQRQQQYETYFAKQPLAAQGSVRVENLLCGRQVCIGSVTGYQQHDLDAFFAGALRPGAGDPRIYALSATLLDNAAGAVRRFVFSTDPELRELPFKGDSAR